MSESSRPTTGKQGEEEYNPPLHSKEPRYGIFGIFSTCLLLAALWMVPQSWVDRWLVEHWANLSLYVLFLLGLGLILYLCAVWTFDAALGRSR